MYMGHFYIKLACISAYYFITSHKLNKLIEYNFHIHTKKYLLSHYGLTDM